MVIFTRSAAKFWWKEDLPAGVKYLTKNHAQDKWTAVTYKELNEKRKDQQDCNISRKLRYDTTVIKPCYIWVFNVDWFLFGGWWIYVKTAKEDWGINFRHERNMDLVLKAMQLFPCRVVPELDNFDFWAEKFAKRFAHVGFQRNKDQGLVRCRCKIDGYGKLIDIFI